MLYLYTLNIYQSNGIVMSKYFLTYIIVLTIFLAIDAVWLGLIAKKFYFSNLGYILADRPNMVAAVEYPCPKYPLPPTFKFI